MIIMIVEVVFLAWMMSMTMPKLMVPFFSMDSRSDYPRSANGDYQDGNEINGGRLAKPQDFPW